MHGQPFAPGLDINLAIRRGPHRLDQRCAGAVAFEAMEFFRGDDHDLVAAAYCNMLRAVAAGAAHQFAESRLCVLEAPAARQGVVQTSHTDQNITSALPFATPA